MSYTNVVSPHVVDDDPPPRVSCRGMIDRDGRAMVDGDESKDGTYGKDAEMNNGWA